MGVFHFSDARANVLAVYYVEIAAKNYLQAEKQLNDLRGHSLCVDELAIGREIFQHAVTCIVFSALTIESYINDYLCKIVGDMFFYDNLQSLSVISKLQLCYRIITSKELDKETSACYALLKKLMKMRNEFVHNKSYECPTMSVEDVEFYNEALAQGLVQEHSYEDFISSIIEDRTIDLTNARDSLRAVFEVAKIIDSIDDHAYSEIVLLGGEIGFGHPEEVAEIHRRLRR